MSEEELPPDPDAEGLITDPVGIEQPSQEPVLLDDLEDSDGDS